MADLHILQHSLGLDQYGQGEACRNHFVTGPGSTDFDACVDMVAGGLMSRRQGGPLTGGDDLFLVTDAGREFVRTNSPAPPKLSRSAQRYQRFLNSGSWLSFRDWLRNHG